MKEFKINSQKRERVISSSSGSSSLIFGLQSEELFEFSYIVLIKFLEVLISNLVFGLSFAFKLLFDSKFLDFHLINLFF